MQVLRVHFGTYRCPVLPLKEASALNPGFRDLYLKTAEFPFQIVYIQMSKLVYIQVQTSVDKEQGKTGGAIVYERERDGDRQYLYQKLLVHVVRRRLTYTSGCRTDYTRVKKKKINTQHDFQVSTYPHQKITRKNTAYIHLYTCTYNSIYILHTYMISTNSIMYIFFENTKSRAHKLFNTHFQ